MRKGGKVLRKSISLFLSVVMLFIPLIVNAQETINEEKAKAVQAEADAESDVNTAKWFGAGCLFKVFRVGAVYLLAPSLNETRILGKSPEYVRAYTKAYNDKKKSWSMEKRIGCCVIAACVVGVIGCILINNWFKDLKPGTVEGPDLTGLQCI